MVGRPKLQLAPVSTATGKLDLTAGTAQVAIAAICLRRDGDARPLSAAHVVTLAESIAALGILEPVVVDLEGYLLAGGHRLAAVQLLAMPMIMARRRAFLDRVIVDGGAVPPPGSSAAAAEPPLGALRELADRMAEINTQAFNDLYPKNRVPVVAVDTSGKNSMGLALAVEAAENSVRRQYSRDEVRALAERLKAAGYVSRPGRPSKNQKSARPVLEALLGCSGRHLLRLLGEDNREQPSEWDLAEKALLRAAARVQEAGKHQRSDAKLRLVKLAEQVSAAGSE